MKTMKRRYWKLTLFFIALFTAGFISSCKKNNGNPSPMVTTSSGIANVAVTNASPTTINYSVYADTTNIYPAGTLAYGSTTGILNGNPYETISDSTHSIFLSGNGVRINIDSNMTFQDSGYYSVFVYDTGALKAISLQDDFSATPPSGDASVRFLNLSPNSPVITANLMGIDTTKDSLTFLSLHFVGSGSFNDSVAPFKPVTAGSYKVLVNSSETNLFTVDAITFSPGNFYTLYLRGYVNTSTGPDSLAVGVIQNH